jgi:hypothetical protein
MGKEINVQAERDESAALLQAFSPRSEQAHVAYTASSQTRRCVQYCTAAESTSVTTVCSALL